MSHNIPQNLKYTKEHEWALIEGNTATIGITDYAQSSLGDIVFVEVPAKGKKLERNSTFGVVESIKSVSDLYSPLSGEVTEINQELVNTPELCNKNPYSSWMIKLKISNPNEISELFSAEQYRQYCQSL